MRTISRRTVLAGAAGAAGLGLLGSGVAAAAPGRIAVTREEHRVVVVGSDSAAGSPRCAWRRPGAGARAGARSALGHRPERGDLPAGPDQPRPQAVLARHRLRPAGRAAEPAVGAARAADPEHPGRGPAVPGRYTGLLERVGGNGMDVFCAAGVGGGSLLYQGMTLQPTAELFAATMPRELDYDVLAREHYPRVARMLRLATAPDELIDSPPTARRGCSGTVPRPRATRSRRSRCRSTGTTRWPSCAAR